MKRRAIGGERAPHWSVASANLEGLEVFQHRLL
jgi:hypothetical protein